MHEWMNEWMNEWMVKAPASACLASFSPQHWPSAVWLQCFAATLRILRWFCPYQENMPEIMMAQSLDLGTGLAPASVLLDSNPEAIVLLGCLGGKTTVVSCLSCWPTPIHVLHTATSEPAREQKCLHYAQTWPNQSRKMYTNVYVFVRWVQRLNR